MEDYTLSYTHRCINPPPCILICSICCKLHYPCSQHRFLCTTNITESLDVSASLSEYLLWIFRSILSERRDQHVPWFHLFCLSWSYLFKFLYIQPSFLFLSEHLHYLPLSLSLSSISHPQSFSCGALMHAKARFLSVSHPIIINLSPTHKPITQMGWLVREGLSIRGRGICHVLPLVAPWLQGRKGCLAAPGTGHHHYSLLVLLLSQMHL